MRGLRIEGEHGRHALYAIGHTNSPPFNSWLSNVLPEETRGRYIGGRMFIVSVTTMVYIYLASTWLDWQNKTYAAFAANEAEKAAETKESQDQENADGATVAG